MEIAGPIPAAFKIYPPILRKLTCAAHAGYNEIIREKATCSRKEAHHEAKTQKARLPDPLPLRRRNQLRHAYPYKQQHYPD